MKRSCLLRDGNIQQVPPNKRNVKIPALGALCFRNLDPVHNASTNQKKTSDKNRVNMMKATLPFQVQK